MFIKHYGNRSCLFRKSYFFHRGEKKIFFFHVMTLIGKALQKIEYLIEMIEIDFLFRIELSTNPLKNGKHKLNSTVFFFENVGWLHCSSLNGRQVFCRIGLTRSIICCSDNSPRSNHSGPTFVSPTITLALSFTASIARSTMCVQPSA